MKTTSGAVSNICYADKEFAAVRLGQLQQAKTIGFWALVEHPAYTKPNGEERKKHLHIYIEAGQSRIDLESVAKYLEQAVAGEALPRKCKAWTRSNPIDWLAYAAHDSDYMRFKNLVKPYYDIPLTEFATSDMETLIETWDALPRDKWKSAIRKVMEAVEQGLTFAEYADRQNIPLAMLGSALRIYNALWGERLAIEQRRMIGFKEEEEPQQPEQLRIWTTDPPKDSPF